MPRTHMSINVHTRNIYDINLMGLKISITRLSLCRLSPGGQDIPGALALTTPCLLANKRPNHLGPHNLSLPPLGLPLELLCPQACLCDFSLGSC